MNMKNDEIDKQYKLARWKNPEHGLRIQILRRDHFECQDCRKEVAEGKRSEVKKAEHVHHIMEARDFPELFWEPDNLISLCHYHHDVRHGRVPEKIGRKKPRLTQERW